MMATRLTDVINREPTPSAEEDLHLRRVSDRDMERSFLAGGFSGVMVDHECGICSLELAVPPNIDRRVLKAIVSEVRTNDVICATMTCGTKVHLELRDWTEDSAVAAGVWFDRLIAVLSSLDKSTRNRLIKADQKRADIVSAIIQNARSSSFGSLEH